MFVAINIFKSLNFLIVIIVIYILPGFRNLSYLDSMMDKLLDKSSNFG